jgi:hypothetical protein
MTQPSSTAAENQLSPEHAGELARLAALPLPRERWPLVADILGPWLKDANELSQKMSQAAHQSLVPATVFIHGTSLEKEADQ